MLQRLSAGGRQPWQAWLRAHAGLSAAATVLGVGHAIASITEQRLPPAQELGLVLASAAAGLLVLQALIGLSLRDPTERRRASVRRSHRLAAAGVVVLVALHAVLNGPLPR